MLIFNKNTSNNTVYHSSYFIGMSVPHGPAPLSGGQVLIPWPSFSSGLHLVLAFVVDVNTSSSL